MPRAGRINFILPTNLTVYDYKYNGKELQDELGLNVYAYGWRDYDPAIGRFTKIDRFAEKYHKLTPYGYAGNNPVLINDVQGDSLWISFGKNEKALYENLLFLDADTFPVHENFLSKYSSLIDKDEKIVYGGILYESSKPSKNELLRWIYGTKREALNVFDREKNPYLSFLTLNFLIKKSIDYFTPINSWTIIVISRSDSLNIHR